MPLPKLARLLGKRVSEIRKRQGLTQAFVAEQTGIEYKYYQRLEAPGGRPVNPKLTTLARLCAVLDVRLDQLLRNVSFGGRGGTRGKVTRR